MYLVPVSVNDGSLMVTRLSFGPVSDVVLHTSKKIKFASSSMKVNSNLHPWVCLKIRDGEGGCATFVNLVGDHTTRQCCLRHLRLLSRRLF